VVPKVTVPDVVGKTAEEAASAVTEAGLGPIQIEYPGDAGDGGTILAQLPAGGREVPEGFPVLMLVSTGPRAEQLPEDEVQ